MCGSGLSSSHSVREALARRIAGEIILSSNPGGTMKKWRGLFAVSQMRLSEKMVVSSSVISDYESGRRKSPGTRFVKRFVWALFMIDEDRGGRFIKEFFRLTSSQNAAILDLREFPLPVRFEHFCKAISGEVIACSDEAIREICGYTIIDSARAMEILSGWDFFQIFGTTTERSLIFTNITEERLPMMAVRISPLKPRVVVFHGTQPDELSVKLAGYDRVSLIYSKAQNLEHLTKSLRHLYRIALRRKLGMPMRPSAQAGAS